jgi:hypothetical protein
MAEKSYYVQDIVTMVSDRYSPDRYMANYDTDERSQRTKQYKRSTAIILFRERAGQSKVRGKGDSVVHASQT